VAQESVDECSGARIDAQSCPMPSSGQLAIHTRSRWTPPPRWTYTMDVHDHDGRLQRPHRRTTWRQLMASFLLLKASMGFSRLPLWKGRHRHAPALGQACTSWQRTACNALQRERTVGLSLPRAIPQPLPPLQRQSLPPTSSTATLGSTSKSRKSAQDSSSTLYMHCLHAPSTCTVSVPSSGVGGGERWW